MPLVGHTPERVDAAVVELDPGAHDEILDGGGHEDLSRRGQRRDPGADVDGDAADIGPVELDLARVEAGPDLQPQVSDSGDDRLRAANRTSRTVERREESVASRNDLPSTEPLELVACDRVMAVEQLLPGVIAK